MNKIDNALLIALAILCGIVWALSVALVDFGSRIRVYEKFMVEKGIARKIPETFKFQLDE